MLRDIVRSRTSAVSLVQRTTVILGAFERIDNDHGFEGKTTGEVCAGEREAGIFRRRVARESVPRVQHPPTKTPDHAFKARNRQSGVEKLGHLGGYRLIRKAAIVPL